MITKLNLITFSHFVMEFWMQRLSMFWGNLAVGFLWNLNIFILSWCVGDMVVYMELYDNKIMFIWADLHFSEVKGRLDEN